MYSIVIFSQNLNFCVSIADDGKLIIGIPIKTQMVI